MPNATDANDASPKGGHEDTWGEYRVWAKTSRILKNGLAKIRKRVLGLTLAGAVLGALAQQAPDIIAWMQPVLGALAGLLLTLAGLLARQLVTPEKRENQIRARSAAEALKASVYLYVTETPPYDVPEAHKLLWDKTDALSKKVQDIGSEILTDAEREKRLPAFPMSVEAYVEDRVKDQIKYYREKAVEHGRAVEWGKRAALGFAVAAALLGALAGLSPLVSDLALASGWIPVVGAFSGAVAAYLYAERHEYLEISYRSTDRRLTRLSKRWGSLHSERSDVQAQQALSQACEAAISVENQAWMAEFLGEDDPESLPSSPPAPEFSAEQ